MKYRAFVILAMVMLLPSASIAEGRLFSGLEGSAPSTKSSDLIGFPDVTWTDHYSFDVSGAAATPDDTLYLCNGAFNTDLYIATLNMDPVFLTEISEDIASLAFGRDTLWGYSNYATIKGIYSINLQTGDATLKIDTYTGTGFRFFALGYNLADDKLYGYTEYGVSGLYSIDIDTGNMLKVADPIPASNTQGRGLAVGDNIVYLTATRGDDGIPYYAYDISQGTGGVWLEFTNPYPAYHSTGGAAWLPGTTGVQEQSSAMVYTDQLQLSVSPNPVRGITTFTFQLPIVGNASLEIYDTSGRRRAVVMNACFNTGHGEVAWSAHNLDLPTGVYVAVLRLGNQTVSQRLLLIDQ